MRHRLKLDAVPVVQPAGVKLRPVTGYHHHAGQGGEDVEQCVVLVGVAKFEAVERAGARLEQIGRVAVNELVAGKAVGAEKGRAVAGLQVESFLAVFGRLRAMKPSPSISAPDPPCAVQRSRHQAQALW